MGLIGAGLSFASDTFGKGGKPRTAPYVPVDPTQSEADTIAAAKANLPGAEDVTSKINAFSQGQLEAEWAKILPDYKAMVSSAAGTLRDQIAGKIPAADIAALMTSDAGKALYGGYGGSGMARNLSARDLGLSEYQVTQQGIQGLQSLMATLKGTMIAPQASVTNMLLDAGTVLSNQTQQREFQWQADLTNAKLNALPDPRDAAFSQTLGGLGSTMMGVGAMGALGGGSMGGGGSTAPAWGMTPGQRSSAMSSDAGWSMFG